VNPHGELANKTNIVEAATRFFSKLPPSDGRKLVRWVPPPEHQEREARLVEEKRRDEELAGRPRRFKDRFANNTALKNDKAPRLQEFIEHPGRRHRSGLF